MFQFLYEPITPYILPLQGWFMLLFCAWVLLAMFAANYRIIKTQTGKFSLIKGQYKASKPPKKLKRLSVSICILSMVFFVDICLTYGTYKVSNVSTALILFFSAMPFLLVTSFFCIRDIVIFYKNNN